MGGTLSGSGLTTEDPEEESDSTSWQSLVQLGKALAGYKDQDPEAKTVTLLADLGARHQPRPAKNFPESPALKAAMQQARLAFCKGGVEVTQTTG